MIKAMRYLKPFWFSVLMIIGLVFLQVQFDLALPDYMSNIVTYGIQYGGISDTLPQALSAETFTRMQYFTDKNDAAVLISSYELNEDGVYILTQDSEEVRKAVSDPFLIVSFLSSEEAASQMQMDP